MGKISNPVAILFIITIKNRHLKTNKAYKFSHKLWNKPIKLKARKLEFAWFHMRRREAIQVLKEISEAMPCVFIYSISIDRLSLREFELKIAACLDSILMNQLKSIIDQRGLLVREENGFLVVGSLTENATYLVQPTIF
jgi:hypothetical protein